MMQPQEIRGVVTENPLAQLPAGASIPLEIVPFGGSDATAIPQGTINWTFFEGALLMVVVRTGAGEGIVGTAVVLAPGLAVTATHLFGDCLPEVGKGKATVFCVGPTTAGAFMWQVNKLNYSDRDDIAYMSLELRSPVFPDWRLYSIAVTTRTPEPGETLSVIGFKFPTIMRESSHTFRAEGGLYVAVGKVTNVYHPFRDQLLMPYPTIEVACGSLGGMSGGAVVDCQGYLVGIISRGWQTEEQDGPTYAAWIIGGLNRQLEIPWPPGVYEQPIHILKIDERAMRIEGRERVKVLDDLAYEYQVWFER